MSLRWLFVCLTPGREIAGNEIHRIRTQWQESYACGNIHKHWRTSDWVILQHCWWPPHAFIPNRTLLWCALWWWTPGQDECELQGGEMLSLTQGHIREVVAGRGWVRCLGTLSSVLTCWINHPTKYIYFIRRWWSEAQPGHSTADLFNISPILFVLLHFLWLYFPHHLCLITHILLYVDGSTIFLMQVCENVCMCRCTEEKRRERGEEGLLEWTGLGSVWHKVLKWYWIEH